jgi:protein involved in polysaccharide export with SLBB domain
MFSNANIKQLMVLLIIFVLCQVFGCAVRPRLDTGTSPAEPQAAGDEYIPGATLSIPDSGSHEYLLGPGDILTVKFFNNEELNEEVTVRPDGRISLQRVGDILVHGITPAALTEIIAEKYSEIILNPEVTVIVSEFGGNAVYVFGEVSAPGSYPIQRNMTIIRALAAAGGPTDEANLGSVILIRMIDKDRISAKRLDLSLPVLHRGPNLDVHVRAFDIVFVPKTFIANIRAFVTQIYDTILPPLDLYARSLLWSKVWK